MAGSPLRIAVGAAAVDVARCAVRGDAVRAAVAGEVTPHEEGSLHRQVAHLFCERAPSSPSQVALVPIRVADVFGNAVGPSAANGASFAATMIEADSGAEPLANEAGADAQAHADTHALANEGCHEVPNAKAVAGADVVPLAEARGGDRCAVGRDRRQRR